MRRVFDITLSLVSICARFLWTILTMPGGWIQASPSTCTGTPSSPRMVIFTWRHWDAAEQKTAAVRWDLSFFFSFFFVPAKHRELSPAWPPPSSAARRRSFLCDLVTHAPPKVHQCVTLYDMECLYQIDSFHVFLWLCCHVDMLTKGTNTRNII